MTKVIAPEDQVVLDRLLTRLARSIDGAIDLWTVLCLAHENGKEDLHDFIEKNCELMRALVLVAKAFLAETHLADDEKIHEQLATMLAGCQQLRKAFLVLEQHHTASPAEARSATAALAEVRADLHTSIRELGKILTFPISYWQRRTPEQEEYIQSILQRLSGLFTAEQPVGAS